MMQQKPFRRDSLAAALVALLMLSCVGSELCAAQLLQQPPAPIERRAPSPMPQGAQARQGLRGEHLAEWMNQHSSLTPQQQQQALQQEPGFHDLPQTTQQRYLDRLAQLDAMNPRRRQRVLARTEAMERLNPQQRAQVRGAMAQLGNLPQQQRRAVAETFRALRSIPASERMQAYQSGRYGPPLDGTQQAVLMNLLRVEPLMGAMLTSPGRQPSQQQQPVPQLSFH